VRYEFSGFEAKGRRRKENCPLPSALCLLPSAFCPLPSALCLFATILHLVGNLYKYGVEAFFCVKNSYKHL
jgi:hypothetical protein